MEISQTQLKIRLRRKTSPLLIETINEARKNKSWNSIAKILSGSTRKLSRVNLSEIDRQSKVGDTILIPGKVLSQGEISKKIKIIALSISENAREKLKSSKSEFVSILDEIKKNKKAEGVKIIR